MLARGQAAFRGVRLSALTREDLVSSTGQTRVAAQSVSLGEVDAFVSHSWLDDPDAKWEALCSWCRTFTRTHGREPVLWIDKVSMDQSSASKLEEELACLPLFIAGCRSMLVLAGPSYVTRLWCVTELWLAHQVGLKPAHVHVEVLPGAHTDIHSFHAWRAVCSKREDTERLQSFIEMSEGGVGEFNKTVEAMLRGRLAGTAVSSPRTGRGANGLTTPLAGTGDDQKGGRPVTNPFAGSGIIRSV